MNTKAAKGFKSPRTPPSGTGTLTWNLNQSHTSIWTSKHTLMQDRLIGKIRAEWLFSPGYLPSSELTTNDRDALSWKASRDLSVRADRRDEQEELLHVQLYKTVMKKKARGVFVLYMQCLLSVQPSCVVSSRVHCIVSYCKKCKLPKNTF